MQRGGHCDLSSWSQVLEIHTSNWARRTCVEPENMTCHRQRAPLHRIAFHFKQISWHGVAL